jgi:predicted DNA-binding protein
MDTSSSSSSPKVVAIRLSDEMVARIDNLRDPITPRAAYVKHLLDKALTAREKQPQK